MYFTHQKRGFSIVMFDFGKVSFLLSKGFERQFTYLAFSSTGRSRMIFLTRCTVTVWKIVLEPTSHSTSITAIAQPNVWLRSFDFLLMCNTLTQHDVVMPSCRWLVVHRIDWIWPSPKGFPKTDRQEISFAQHIFTHTHTRAQTLYCTGRNSIQTRPHFHTYFERLSNPHTDMHLYMDIGACKYADAGIIMYTCCMKLYINDTYYVCIHI